MNANAACVLLQQSQTLLWFKSFWSSRGRSDLRTLWLGWASALTSWGRGLLIGDVGVHEQELENMVRAVDDPRLANVRTGLLLLSSSTNWVYLARCYRRHGENKIWDSHHNEDRCFADRSKNARHDRGKSPQTSTVVHSRSSGKAYGSSRSPSPRRDQPALV